MKNIEGRVVALALIAFWTAATPADAGEVLFQKAFGGGVKKPATFTETIALPPGKAPYLLNLINGSLDGTHRVSSVTVEIDGQVLVSPNELSQQTEAVNRGFERAEENRLSLTLHGSTDSFVQVRILGGTAAPAQPPPRRNVTHDNADGTLSGLNLGDSIALWFDRTDGADRYALSVAPSPDGPWQVLETVLASELQEGKNPTLVDSGDDPESGEPRVATGSFTQETTYYRMEAFDATGGRLREYPAVAVPPFVQPPPAPAPLEGNPAPNPISGLSATAPAAASACDSPCIQNQAFISDDDFVDSDALSLDEIRKILEDNGSFLQGDDMHQIEDVDGTKIDPGQLIADAASDSDISPEVLIATIQKESSAITTSSRPNDTRLKSLAGFGSPSTISDQISDAAAQLRRDYDRVSGGGQTLGGWKPGSEKMTLDGKTVCPENNAAAVLYQYTPYVGAGWGGSFGGNSLFFKVFYDTLGFGDKPEFCGLYKLTGEAPTGDIHTRRPTLKVMVGTAADCKTTYKLSLDGAEVKSGDLTGSGEVSHEVTADLEQKEHTAKIEVEATDCGIKASKTWKFKVLPGRKVGMVIDDTGSMADDLQAVKAALSSFIASLTSDPNGPDIEWTLVTFKDHVSVRGTTTDTATIQSLVGGLFASGGGDCPEESLGGLSTAASILSGGEESKDIVFATDASPQGGAGTVSSTLAALQASGVRVHTLLTGDCVFGLDLVPTSSLVLSSRQVFSLISSETGGLFFFLPGASVSVLTAALNEIFETAGGGGDTTPPVLTVEVSPAVLWPVQHQMVEIAPVLTVGDDTDPTPGVELLSVVSSEPDDAQGSGRTEGDVVVTEDGRIFLRAERSGSGNTRVYTVTYQAIDASGNRTTASADVLVPHDQGS